MNAYERAAAWLAGAAEPGEDPPDSAALAAVSAALEVADPPDDGWRFPPARRYVGSLTLGMGPDPIELPVPAGARGPLLVLGRGPDGWAVVGTVPAGGGPVVVTPTRSGTQDWAVMEDVPDPRAALVEGRARVVRVRFRER